MVNMDDGLGVPADTAWFFVDRLQSLHRNVKGVADSIMSSTHPLRISYPRAPVDAADRAKPFERLEVTNGGDPSFILLIMGRAESVSTVYAFAPGD